MALNKAKTFRMSICSQNRNRSLSSASVHEATTRTCVLSVVPSEQFISTHHIPVAEYLLGTVSGLTVPRILLYPLQSVSEQIPNARA